MAIRNILTYPDPLLNRLSRPIEEFDAALANLVADMVETMRQAEGIGLAAPQIGEPIRLIVLEVPDESEQPPVIHAVCNPIVKESSGAAKIEEGCLSVPGLYVEVDRAAEVTVEGQNPDGSPFSLRASGLLAICFQHEIDHLDGKLIVAQVSALKREQYRREMKRRKAEGGSPDDRRQAL